MMTEDQIKHLEEHQAEFNDLMCGERNVREYAAEYSHVDGIYEALCTDLDIEPRVQMIKRLVIEIENSDSLTNVFAAVNLDALARLDGVSTIFEQVEKS